jgi:copper chaperone CopZ
MKTFKKLFAAALVAIIPLMLNAQDKEKVKNTETVKFATSIDCDACVNKIMTNLPHEKGVKDVKCDLSTKEVTVTYQKEKNDSEELKKAIEKLGFTAKNVNKEPAKK